MRVPVEGAELHVEIEGAGPALVVAGAVGMEYMQFCLSAALRDALTLVFVDMRGSGRSTGDQDAITAESLIDDLEAVRRHAGFDRVAVMGHSANGRFGLEYAARHPGSVSHVVCVGSPPELGSDTELVQRYWDEHAEPERKRIAEAAIAENTQESFVRLDAVRRWYEIGFDASAIESRYRPLEPGWFQKVFSECFAGPAPLSAVECPVLFAMGRSDFLVPPVVLDGVTLPARASVVVFERSAHSPFYEEQALFDATVIDWLTTN